MVAIPAAFDGTLHLDATTHITGTRMRVHSALNSDRDRILLRLSEDQLCGDYATASLTPEDALLLGQALTRLAYRALDERKQ